MLGRREAFAATAMQGLLSNAPYCEKIRELVAKSESTSDARAIAARNSIARDAVHMADALMHALTEEEHEWTAEIRNGDGAEFHR